MTSNQIRTPLLRMFAHLHGHTGIQCFPVFLTNPKSLLNLSLNLLLFTLINYWFTFADPWQAESVASQLRSQRPFLAMLTGGLTFYTFPILTLMRNLYFFVKGRAIIKLLDNDYYLAAYKTVNAKQVLALILIPLLAHTLLLYPESISHPHFLTNSLLIAIFNLTCTLSPLIVHYYQYGNLKVLQAVSAQLKNNVTSAKQTIQQIGKLSQISSQLNRTLSLPILCNLLINMLDVMATLCHSFTKPTSFWNNPFLYYTTAPWCYLLYISTLNRQVLQCLRQIKSQLGHISHLGSVDLYQTYEPSFQLQLWTLLTITLSTLLHAALCMLSITVFVVQTD